MLPAHQNSPFEVRAGIEPAHGGFADRSVTTSPPDQYNFLNEPAHGAHGPVVQAAPPGSTSPPDQYNFLNEPAHGAHGPVVQAAPPGSTSPPDQYGAVYQKSAAQTSLRGDMLQEGNVAHITMST